MKKQKTSLSKRRIFAIPCLVLIALLISANAFPSGASAIDQPPLILILVRHAEKKIVPKENKDPDLSPAGVARAEELVKMLSSSGITAIFATEYKRTQQTAKPLSEKLRFPINVVEAKKTPELVKQIRARGAGQVIFIAGHNNTVPEIIAAFGGPQMLIIPETEFDNLYILVIESDGTAKLVKLKYGSSWPVGGQGMVKQ
jgi:2,3-bisphosphoglycerate-dependent phosphoglycerate mutase